MKPEDVEKYFTRNDGSFSFSRWGRSVAPVAFGLEDKSIKNAKGMQLANSMGLFLQKTNITPASTPNMNVSYELWFLKGKII